MMQKIRFVNEKKNSFLLIYDVADNKRRYKLAKVFESYGVRVQESAFEFYLSKEQTDELLDKIPHIIQVSDDSVRYYPLRSLDHVYSWDKCSKDIAYDIVIC